MTGQVLGVYRLETTSCDGARARGRLETTSCDGARARGRLETISCDGARDWFD